MVHEKYIEVNGKTYGPYYYESYRDGKGNVRKRYVKDHSFVPERRVNLFRVGLLLFGVLLLGFFAFGNVRISGFAVATGNLVFDEDGSFGFGGNIIGPAWWISDLSELFGLQGLSLSPSGESYDDFTINITSSANVNQSSIVNVDWDGSSGYFPVPIGGGEINTAGVHGLGLVALWHLNNDSNFAESESVIYDFSDTGYNASAGSGATFSSNGKFGGAYEFTGTQSTDANVLTASSISEIQGVSAFSVAFWVRSDISDFTSNSWFVSQFREPFYFRVTSSEVLEFSVRNDVGSSQTASTSVVWTPGEWRHIAGTYDGSNVILYLDGVAVDSQPHSGLSDGGTRLFDIGGDSISGSTPWDGAIDEVGVWDRALNPAIVTQIYNLGNAIYSGSFVSEEVDTSGSYFSVGAEWSESGSGVSVFVSNGSSTWCSVGNGGTMSSSQCLGENFTYRVNFTANTNLDFLNVTWSNDSGPICGDGVIEGSEQCDGVNLDGESCVSLGFDSGSLGCSALTCQFDTSECVSSVPPGSIFVDWELSSDCTDGDYSIANRDCSGSDGDAYDTMQEAADVVNAGDTVVIRGGTYSDQVFASPRCVSGTSEVGHLEIIRGGTSGNPVTFRNYPGESVLIDATNNAGGPSEKEVGVNVCADYVVVEGLDVYNAWREGYQIYSNYTTIQKTKVYESGNDYANGAQQAVDPGFWVRKATTGVVLNNTLSYNNGRGYLFGVDGAAVTGNEKVRNCVLSYSIAFNNTNDEEDSDGVQTKSAENCTISHVWAYANGDDGFDIFGRSHFNMQEYNVAFGHPALVGGTCDHGPVDGTCMGDGNGFKPGVWGSSPGGPGNEGGLNNTLRHSFTFLNKVGLNNNAVGQRIYNSIIYNNSVDGIIFDESTSNDGAAIMKNTVVYDNGDRGQPLDRDILFNAARPNPIAESDYNYISDGSSTNDHSEENGHEVNSLDGTVVGVPQFVNESIIIDGDEDRIPDVFEGANGMLDRALSGDAFSAIVWGEGVLQQAFGLQSTSPLIDNGTDLGLGFLDMNGSDIGGSAPDIGAFEFSVGASTYYVDVDSLGGSCSDSSNDGLSLATPFCTIGQAASVVAIPGDRVLIRGGTYNEGNVNLNADGSAGSLISFENYNGESVIVDSTGFGRNFNIFGRYVLLSGLELLGASGKSVRIESTDHVSVQNCIIHDANEGISVNDSHYVLIEGCSIYNTTQPIFPDIMNYSVIRNNVFFNNSATVDPGGVQFSIIEQNYFRHPDSGTIGSLKLREANLNAITNGGTIVRRNVFVEGKKYSVLLASANGALVYHNTFYNFDEEFHERGLLYLQQDAIQPNANNSVRNNIFRQTNDTLINIHENMATWAFDQDIDSNLYWKTVNNGEDYIRAPDPAQPTQQKGYSRAMMEASDRQWQLDYGYDLHSFVADPLLQSPGKFSQPFTFAPSGSSPAVDAALALTSVRESRVGTTVAVNNSHFFSDGYGLVSGDVVRVGDRILLVENVDAAIHVLTVNESISTSIGDNVSLVFGGSAPDMGAYEIGLDVVIGNASGSERAFGSAASVVCGDGMVEGSEVCDPAGSVQSCVLPNTYGGEETCAADCLSYSACVATEFCGDSSINGPEQCDDGNSVTESCTYGSQGCIVCDAFCQNAQGATTFCGDGFVDVSNGEQCDDGNSVTESCTYGQMSCTICNSSCQDASGATSFCGDGIVDGSNGETCDDGALNGQPNQCNSSCSGTTTSVCGNSVTEAGEQCDDGNSVSTDTCNSCVLTSCGDGIIQDPNGQAGSEVCDDGALNGQPNQCNSMCTGTTSPLCGNGAVESGEECDNGGTNGNNASCTLACTNAVCGDSLVWNNDGGSEQCDAGPGGSVQCTSGCLLTVCGDGIIQNPNGEGVAEVCDGGSQACIVGGYSGTQDCSLSCLGFDSCATSEFCGDGIVNGPEQCDDSGTVNGDGCDSSCMVESGWQCDGQNPSSCSVLCSLTDAYWNQSSAVQGDIVGLVIEGTSCDGEELNFTVIEDDGILPDDFATVQPANVFFGGSFANGVWTAEWEQDQFLSDPEWYFVATLIRDGSVSISSGTLATDLLNVSERVCTVDADCNDGAFCNGVETCDTQANTCVAGTPPVLDDGVGCTIDSCDEVNDVVVNSVQDSLCDDGLFCNGIETCDAVLDCQPGSAPSVDDGAACTIDSCDETNDVIVHSVNQSFDCGTGMICMEFVNCVSILPNADMFNGSTTNFSEVSDVTNVTDAVLEIIGFGSINFSGEVDFAGLDLDSYVQIDNATIGINTSEPGMSRFVNTPAELSFYNLVFEGPTLLRDGIECLGSGCTFVDYSGGTYRALVDGFSEYEVVEDFVQLSACQDLDQPGVTYNLTQDVSNLTSTCFSISADDVVLEGNGFRVAGGNLGDGISVQADNVRIQNIEVFNFSDGIDLILSENVSIENVATSEIRFASFRFWHVNSSLVRNVSRTKTIQNAGRGFDISHGFNNRVESFYFTGAGVSPGIAFFVIDQTNLSVSDVFVNNSIHALHAWFNSSIHVQNLSTLISLSEDIVFVDNGSLRLTNSVVSDYDFDSNSIELSVVNSLFGRVLFNESVNGSGSNLSDSVAMSDQHIVINSSENLGLNRSAFLDFFASVNDPRLARDGVDCSDCVLLSNSGGVVSYFVPSSGVYTISDANPGSGGGSTTGGGGGSGGGGGGGSPSAASSSSCQERWVCSSWSECVSGTQTRVCQDENGCGSDEFRPAEFRECNLESSVIVPEEEVEGEQILGNPLKLISRTALVAVGGVLVIAIVVVIAILLITRIRSGRTLQKRQVLQQIARRQWVGRE